MKTVILEPTGDNVLVRTEARVLDTLIARNCRVGMACGGNGFCATCHVYIREGQDAVTPMTKREQSTLSVITNVRPESRLACQAHIIGEGVVIELPEGMYLESINDLMRLVGTRAPVPILHPKDGRILVEKGKIITRSRILELQEENFDQVYNHLRTLN